MPSPKPKIRKDYFWKEKKLLKFFGISLSGNESTLYKVYSFILIFSLNYLYPFLELGDVFKHDFEVVADILMYLFAVYVAMAKTTAVLRGRIKFGEILDKLQRKPFLPNLKRGGEIELKLIEDCLWITSAQTSVYWVVGYGSIFMTIVYTLIKRLGSDDYHDWQFAYGPFTILNVTYSPNYEISWFYQNISILSVAAHFTTFDLLVASVLAHISFQYRMLQNFIKNSVEYSRKLMDKQTLSDKYGNAEESRSSVSSVSWKYLQKTIEEIVNYHLAIIDIVDEIEKVFSDLLLVVFLGTLGMICFRLYQTSVLPLNDVRLIRFLTEILTMCLQVVTVCFWGEQVLHESYQVGEAAYSAHFVGTDLKFQKGLILIIRRSQYPTRLTAGQFTDICLSTFAWILRTSYSAFMVLRNNNAKNT